MKKVLIFIGAIAASVVFSPAAFSQQNCYQVAADYAPNPRRCVQIGQEYWGTPIWACCSPASFSEQNCYQVAADYAPNPRRCVKTGQEYWGTQRTIWACCS